MLRSVSIATTAALCVCGSASAQLFQPDSAIAGSEFNDSYLIGYTIDGSGLPAGFGPESSHGTYVVNNHWTTRSGALQRGEAWAEFYFSDPQSVRRFHMWNHRSNNIAADPGYAVTEFNISFFDANDVLIHEALGLSALPNVLVAQTYDFGLMHGVSKVRFDIVANNGSTQYTGLAEVAFDTVPTPGAMSILGLAAMGLTRRRR